MKKNWRIKRHAIERAAEIYSCSKQSGCQEILHRIDNARIIKTPFGRQVYKTLRYWGQNADIEYLWGGGLLFTVANVDTDTPAVITVTRKSEGKVRFA